MRDSARATEFGSSSRPTPEAATSSAIRSAAANSPPAFGSWTAALGSTWAGAIWVGSRKASSAMSSQLTMSSAAATQCSAAAQTTGSSS
ncbi:hypothetical protein [Nesterenkonia sp. PF2B19]|uniref:hypothetical protein n=1 Tax=Nesterenkonia sp. PF2B19 TaxID=1881858 RepID=UPI001482A793|nr:hypothetical protein [Nesterenkonia sp. PF2B19]